MSRPVAHISAAIILLAACSAIAGPWINVGTGRGYRISMRHTQASDPLIAASQWRVHLQRGKLILRWTCTPFEHTEQPELVSNAVIQARVSSVQGPAAVKPHFARAKTNIASKGKRAGINMLMRGTGKVDLDMQVELSDSRAAAGTYCSTVVLTVTAP